MSRLRTSPYVSGASTCSQIVPRSRRPRPKAATIRSTSICTVSSDGSTGGPSTGRGGPLSVASQRSSYSSIVAKAAPSVCATIVGRSVVRVLDSTRHRPSRAS